MKYQAKRSFFGDLGSIRRNQVLEVEDGRLADELVKRGLLAKHVEPNGAEAEPHRKTLKAKGSDQ